PNRHRELAAPLQHDQAARLTWIQATGTGGIRARLRRVAGCAIPSGSAGHAGETANLKLTFHLDHSEGADHTGEKIDACEVAARPSKAGDQTKPYWVFGDQEYAGDRRGYPLDCQR